MTGALIPASRIPPTTLPLIWRDRIPVSSLTVVAGDPGLGKSTLSTTIAAELSQEGLNVAISNHEDDMAAVIRPRLDVAGADLDRVHLVPPESAWRFPRDLERLRRDLRECEADCLMLDPAAAHFAPERRLHDRVTLHALIQVARDCRCAIVAIHHIIKTRSARSALDAIGGPNGGLAGTARAVYVYGFDPEDEDRRALACAKVNGLDEPATLLISHETVEYAAYGKLLEAGMLRIGEEGHVDARKVLHRGRSHAKRDAKCQAWLTEFLAAGEDGARQVQLLREAGIAAGFGWSTLRRAGMALKTEKVRVGFGGDGYWLWRLPDDHPSRQPEAAAA